MQKSFTRALSRVLVPVGLAFGAGASMAAIDITAATTGITDAQTAVLGVLAAMIAMGVAVWGVRKVLRFFGR